MKPVPRRRRRSFVTAGALFVRAAPVALVARVASVLAAGGAPVAAAWLTKSMLDRLAGRPGASVWWDAVGLACIGAVAAIAQHVARYADREIARRVVLATQAELFAAVSRHEGIAELEDPDQQDRLRLAQQAAQIGPQQLAGSVLGAAQTLVSVTGFLITLAAASPLAAALVLASAVPSLYAQLGLGRQRTETMARITPNTRRQLFYSRLLTDAGAAKEIRLFGLGGHFLRRMLDELGTAQQGERATDRRTLWVDGLLALSTAVVSGFALVHTVASVTAGHGGIGEISVVTAALASVQFGLAGIVAQIATASQALILFGHYRDAIAAAPAPARTSGSAAMATATAPTDSACPQPPSAPRYRGIRFEGVWFRYHADLPWVLRGLDLELPHGTAVGLVGGNGAGKSTIVKLLCRLYEPDEGVITWDGRDIATMEHAELRRRIGTVFQDHMAYELSAAENIAVGDLAALDDEARLRAAARDAGIGDVIDRLPDGYGTMLSRGFRAPGSTSVGVLLSGGQWQRLAVARAILRDGADLLILDEPSSGLDAEAEHEIHGMLTRLRTGRTSLLVSHRLNTLRDADRIVVLAEGSVAELGTHESLLDADGLYARLFRLQSAGYAESGLR